MSFIAGQDPYKHNFTPEWSMFFLKRMNELHEADIERKKLEVRQILGIPPTANFKMPSTAPSSSEASAPKKPRYQPTESSPTDRKPARSSIPTNRESSREMNSQSHVEKPQMSIENKSYGKRKQIFTSIDKLEAISDDEDNGVENIEKSLDNLDDDDGVVDESLTVISVLRLLTAFEDMLGSLGPKVVDLLSKAVALEKVRPNLADELLMSADNSVLLDTVKEKLKGLIIAGMVQGKREQAIRKAIRNVGGIVRLIDRKPKELPKASIHQTTIPTQRLNMNEDHGPAQYHSNHIPGTNPSAPLPATATKRSISEAERREDVLKQLATSLMLQGRNVSNEQLEGLVDVYLANHSSSDTPYLFGLQMGERLAKMEDARKAAHAATTLTTQQVFNSIRKNDQQSSSVSLQNRNNDQLTMSSYGNTSNDQQHRFSGGSSFQQQPHVQTVRDNLAWMSSSSYSIGDTDSRGSASQSHQQSGMQGNSMSVNEDRWPNAQPMQYADNNQHSYEQPTSRYSGDTYGNDQMKGPQPWGSGASQMLQSQYKGNQQGQQNYQHQPNTYGQRSHSNMGQQQQNRTPQPNSQFKNKKPNLPSGLKQVQLQQGGQDSGQRQQGNKSKQSGGGNSYGQAQRFGGNQRNQNQKQFNNF